MFDPYCILLYTVVAKPFKEAKVEGWHLCKGSLLAETTVSLTNRQHWFLQKHKGPNNDAQ